METVEELKPCLLNKNLEKGTPVVCPDVLLALRPLSWLIGTRAFR